MTTKKKASNIFSGKNARILPQGKSFLDNFSKPIGKPATILYKKLPDDMILITGFENFLSLDEIKDKYGSDISKVYSNFPCHVSRYTDGIRLMGISTSSIVNIESGQIFNKDTFSKIVSHVKKCGGLLHDIIEAVNSGEVKKITI